MFITALGDPSVGISPITWTLEGDFIFEDQEHLEQFKDNILIAFENAFDDVVELNTVEELDAQYQEELKMEENIMDEFNDLPDSDEILKRMKDIE